jgi:hypothetical protein
MRRCTLIRTEECIMEGRVPQESRYVEARMCVAVASDVTELMNYTDWELEMSI